MKHRLTRIATSELMTLLGLLLFFNPASALGQQSNAPTAPSRSPNPVGPTDPRWQRPPQNEPEVKFRSLTKAVDSAKEEESAPLIMEITQDFERMHAIREEHLVPLSTARVPDYKRLSRVASELTNRANHIRFNISFPLATGDDRKGTSRQSRRDEDIAPMLTELNALIKSFLDNPVFRMARPDDKELRAAAGRDLEGIIKLSERVNKLAKRMSKGARPAG